MITTYSKAGIGYAVAWGAMRAYIAHPEKPFLMGDLKITTDNRLYLIPEHYDEEGSPGIELPEELGEYREQYAD